jgi:hypothetical protein
MCGLLCCSGSSTRTEFLARRFAGPRTWINVANDAQPLLSLGECREVTHVQTETLAALLEPTAHEEGKTLQLFLVRLGECHRRRR